MEKIAIKWISVGETNCAIPVERDYPVLALSSYILIYWGQIERSRFYSRDRSNTQRLDNQGKSCCFYSAKR